jgi:hypothetical protein
MKLQENINRIKQVMGLITEETIEDLRKILQTKFQSLGFNGNEIKREGENIVYKGFSKTKNGNYVITYNPSDNFYTIDYIDGPNKGFKLKRWTENGESKQEWITDSELHIKLVAKIKEFPCLGSHYYNFRQTNDGKIIVGIDWQDDGGIISFNLDDKTYVVKGGKLDGEQGSFLCNGKEIKWGKVTKSGTTKNVTNRMVDDYFNAVTTSKPIIYGMRDKTSEPENGLIFLLQKKLKELNLYTGEPDGQFGPLTYKAVKEFQKTGKDSEGNPLVSDGKVGPKTIQSLGLMD